MNKFVVFGLLLFLCKTEIISSFPILNEDDSSEPNLFNSYENYKNYEKKVIDYIRNLELEMNELNGSDQLSDMMNTDYHNIDKRRRRRYGFWITAINKMGNGGKRSLFKRNGKFIPITTLSSKLLNLPNFG
ncbi:uncharacterized protein [Lepeophtheirus salmonis]|uniref:Uncharacterized protein n=1 Tax=Lepeophtheirus salmonis TaxID=72036 RepID=A0A0K2TTM8_LEPSM|nr:uncharacterized protein LOC121126726 isoform X2 [Lepeophtheirus salmonis]